MLVLRDIFGPYLEDLEKVENLALGDTDLEISFHGVVSMTPAFTTVLVQKLLTWRHVHPELHLKLTGLTQKLSAQIKSSS